MLLSLKMLPWLLPFLRGLFKRGSRRPSPYKRNSGGPTLFLVTGFFVLIVLIILFMGEKMYRMGVVNGNLSQENSTLKYSRETDRELIAQLQTSNETRAHQVSVALEQTRVLRDDIQLMVERNTRLSQTIDVFSAAVQRIEKNQQEMLAELKKKRK